MKRAFKVLLGEMSKNGCQIIHGNITKVHPGDDYVIALQAIYAIFPLKWYKDVVRRSRCRMRCYRAFHVKNNFAITVSQCVSTIVFNELFRFICLLCVITHISAIKL